MALVSINRKIDRLANRSVNKRKALPRKVLLGLLFLLVIFIFSGWQIYSGVKSLKQNGAELALAYTNQNFDSIRKELKEVRGSLQRIDLPMNAFFWVGFIPFLGGYYSDTRGFLGAGIEELNGVDKLLGDLEPHKTELGFNGTPISGQDRITQAMKVWDKVLPKLDSIQGNLEKAASKVQNIDVDKYPENFRGIQLRALMRTAKNFITGSSDGVKHHKDALQVIPNLLGQNQPKNYLLLFQNDKEIRPTGGFITAFTDLKIDQGKVTTTVSDDIYRLDERLLATCQSKICPLTPPAPIVKYLPEVDGKPRSAWSMRDSNISPHLPAAAAEFERMFGYLGQGLPFDGIIYIDTQVVEELIKVTGPIDVYGTKYSSEVDSRCNCPNVIYELESYAEIAAKGEQDRKAILGVLMSQILARSVGADVEKIPELVETIIRLANHKHIMFYLHDTGNQKALSSLNWTGEIKQYDGDYLHINDANFAGGKSNLYVEQTVTQEISTNKNGKTAKKLTIEYKNPQPFNIWLNGINRDYVRVYVPKGSNLISSKGSESTVTTIEDLEKTVFEAFITVRPQNSRKLEIEYEVPYNPSGEYKLMIQKQPGAKDFQYKIKLNGSQKADFKLDMDKEFKF